MNIKEKAWDILEDRLKHEPEGNKAMNLNIKEYMEQAMKEAKKKEPCPSCQGLGFKIAIC